MKNTIEILTLEEKLALLTGKNVWETHDFGGKLDKVVVADGPCGLRKNYFDDNGNLGTIKSTAYPCVHVLANTWNKDLVYETSQAMADDCIENDVDVLLAPGVNIKRTPLNGRNFEYFSEDPYLAGTLAYNFIKGVQSKGVGTSLKHFVANNYEQDRLVVSSEVDERTLNEIYYKPFEIALKAKPTTVMCSYNRLNGEWVSEHRKVLHDVLRKKLNFDGLIVSDWDAVHDRVKSLKATVDLEMPFRPASFNELKTAYENGEITIEEIDYAVTNILNLIKTINEFKPLRKITTSKEDRHEIALKGAEEGIVLLKNQSILPLKDNLTISVFENQADRPMITGEGSARVQTDYKVKTLSSCLKGEMQNSTVNGVQAYWFGNGIVNVDHLAEKLPLAYNSDVAIILAGIDYACEGEANDRQSLKLQPRLENLINEIASVNKNTIVVLSAGSAVDTSAWIDNVKGVIYTGYAGEAQYEACAKIIAGKISPSGKLTETFATTLQDYPTSKIDGNSFVNWYKEGIFVGYRYFDRYGGNVRFPFGFGLTYANFEYSNLQIKDKDDKIEVSYTIKNNSSVDAKEISQVYVKDVFSFVLRPEKELKGFSKDFIKGGKEKAIKIEIDKNNLGYYSTAQDKWITDSGEYEIYVGKSSSDILLSGKFKI